MKRIGGAKNLGIGILSWIIMGYSSLIIAGLSHMAVGIMFAILYSLVDNKLRGK